MTGSVFGRRGSVFLGQCIVYTVYHLPSTPKKKQHNTIKVYGIAHGYEYRDLHEHVGELQSEKVKLPIMQCYSIVIRLKLSSVNRKI